MQNRKIGEGGDPNKIELPRPKTKHKYNYSFSGLKTAATNFLNNLDPNDKVTKADFAASYQEAIVDSLLSNFVKAVNETGVKNISGGGGVMANSRLREKMNIFAENNDLNIYLYIWIFYCENWEAKIARLLGANSSSLILVEVRHNHLWKA